MQKEMEPRSVFHRDRALVLGSLFVISAAAWAYMVYLAWEMGQMDMAMPQMHGWGPVELALLFVMWTVMMVAMMLPSAAPMILMFARVNRKRRAQERPFVPTGVFLLGYLAVWTVFSVLATGVQWGLHAAALLSPMMVSTSPILGGVLLVTAGLYQWMPLKYACLYQCRSPLGFISSQWREGTRGAFIMGVRHGWYCTGCCWSLMALLFVLGVMNLLWVAAIAAFVLLEKVVPAGAWIGRAAGVLLIVWGTLVLISSL